MTTAESDDQRAPRFRRARKALVSVAGYGTSMVLLAISSLLAIPAMVAASGAHAWGAIAVGQSIGGVAAVVIAYGWGLSGPAAIARADELGRMKEYSESAVTKILLSVPIAGLAFLLAWLVGRDFAIFAGIGAVSMASIGLTAGWFFVGRGQPWLMLLFETVPRVGGTIVGIWFMTTGSSALIGVLWQLFGMVAAFTLCSLVILRPWRLESLRSISRKPVRRVLVDQRQGITSSILSSVYASTPIVIVTILAPGAQPVYAVVEKVQRQVIVALGPFVTVLQGWVPRARGIEALHRRVRQGTLATAVFAVALGGLMLAAAPELIRWLGGGVIQPTMAILALMATITAVSLFESVVSKAALSALERLDVVAKSTAIGSLVGLPLVAVGSLSLGALGALIGILVGLVLRLILELVGMRSAMSSSRPASSDPEHPVIDTAIDPELGLDIA
ncbi:O-antigen/teichoic acid export membrane protein [Frigoribacterium sp. UYMn621]